MDRGVYVCGHGLWSCILLVFRVRNFSHVPDVTTLFRCVPYVAKIFLVQVYGRVFLVVELHRFFCSRSWVVGVVRYCAGVVSGLGLDVELSDFDFVLGDWFWVPVLSSIGFRRGDGSGCSSGVGVRVLSRGGCYVLVLERCGLRDLSRFYSGVWRGLFGWFRSLGRGGARDLFVEGVCGYFVRRCECVVRVGLYSVVFGCRLSGLLRFLLCVWWRRFVHQLCARECVVGDVVSSLVSQLLRNLELDVGGGGVVLGRRVLGFRVCDDVVYFVPDGHTLVVGMTGSGKSSTVAYLVRELSRCSRVLVIDFVGAFVNLPGAVVLEPPRDLALDPLQLGFWRGIEVVEDALVYCYGFERGSFSPIVVEVLTRARDRVRELCLRELVDVLRGMYFEFPEGSEYRSAVAAALRRLESLVRYFRPGDFTLSDLGRGVYVIDLSGMDSEVAKTVFALTFMEFLYRLGRLGVGTVLVVDEVHRVAPVHARGESILVKLAREGRKCGLYLILIDQSIAKVSDVVRGQCRNVLFFRLTEPSELRIVEEYGIEPREVQTLRIGECLYYRDGLYAKVKTNYLELAAPRGLKLRRVDLGKLRELARKYGVPRGKREYLIQFVQEHDVEDVIKLLRERSYPIFARSGRLTNFGKAVLEYYGLSVDVPEVKESGYQGSSGE